MFKKKDDKINYEELNSVLDSMNKILKVGVILTVISAIYFITLILKAWKTKQFIITIITILSPLIIGFVVAWLFEPVVAYLKKKGINRTFGTLFTYLVLFIIMAIIVGTLIPLLNSQVKDLVKQIPPIMERGQLLIDSLIEKLEVIPNLNVEAVKTSLYARLEAMATGISNDIPSASVNTIRVIFSGFATFIVGLIVGFFLLISIDEPVKTLSLYLPKQYRDDFTSLIDRVNESFRSFIRGALIDSTLIFVVTSLALYLVGLKAPLLFGLFCALTNVIPYVGPYIGGFPAVIVGFSQSPTIGLLVLLSITIIQLIEGNFFQPLIMSKSTKLHPITIIGGLLIFGHYMGIVGMFVSTPVIAAIKAVIEFLDEKYHFFNKEAKHGN